MEDIEYRVGREPRNNRIGISVKYPEGINEKWSESDVHIECSECGSKNLDTSLTGDNLTLTCLDCPNYWMGFVNDVLGWRDTEESYASVYNLDNFEEVPYDERKSNSKH